jgi:hypothetical protein
MTASLEEKISEAPIVLPPNAFIDSLLTFGRDEATSGVVNVLGSTVCGLFLRNKYDWLLAASGMTIEKVGLFPWYFKEAFEMRAQTPEAERKNIWHYMRDAMRRGMPTLIKDVVVHDPLDYSFMFYGLKAFPDTPTFMISLTSFCSAVVVASVLDISLSELRYSRFKKKCKKAGFGQESYIESRFLVPGSKNPDEVLDAIRKKFQLSPIDVWTYHDVYHSNTLSSYNKRVPVVRFRERTNEGSGEAVRTVQIVYTRAQELQSEGRFHALRGRQTPDPYRYFASRKDKLYFMLDDAMPESPGDIQNPAVRALVESSLDHESSTTRDVRFQRKYCRDPNSLLATVDNVQGDRPFYVLELKTRGNKPELKKAMRYVMREFSPLQITHSKLGLTELNGNAE